MRSGSACSSRSLIPDVSQLGGGASQSLCMVSYILYYYYSRPAKERASSARQLSTGTSVSFVSKAISSGRGWMLRASRSYLSDRPLSGGASGLGRFFRRTELGALIIVGEQLRPRVYIPNALRMPTFAIPAVHRFGALREWGILGWRLYGALLCSTTREIYPSKFCRLFVQPQNLAERALRPPQCTLPPHPLTPDPFPPPTYQSITRRHPIPLPSPLPSYFPFPSSPSLSLDLLVPIFKPLLSSSGPPDSQFPPSYQVLPHTSTIYTPSCVTPQC